MFRKRRGESVVPSIIVALTVIAIVWWFVGSTRTPSSIDLPQGKKYIGYSRGYAEDFIVVRERRPEEKPESYEVYQVNGDGRKWLTIREK